MPPGRHHLRRTLLLGVAVAVAGTSRAVLDPGPAAAATSSPKAAARALCRGKPRTVGTLADRALVEASGLAWSANGVLWAHNDSGDEPRLFAVGRNGSSEGIVTVTGATALDWEDIALGPGPGGDDHLFVGDMGGGGGGGGTRTSVEVYRVPEPSAPGHGQTTASESAAVVTLVYPDGGHDAEALLVDARSGDLVVITKGADAPATVYRADGAATARDGASVLLEAIGPVGQTTETRAGRVALEVAGLGDTADLVTGADASSTGQVAAVRTYGEIVVFAWPKKRSLAEALTTAPCSAPAPLDIRAPQGEAIAFAPNGRRLVTVSEGYGSPLVQLRAR